MIYNYLDVMVEDIKDYIKDRYEYMSEIDKDVLYDDLFCEDSVTGNASGSYTFNSYQVRENVYGNEELLKEVCREFGVDGAQLAEHMFDYEWQDVTIRCHLLYQAMDRALEELEDEGEMLQSYFSNGILYGSRMGRTARKRKKVYIM